MHRQTKAILDDIYNDYAAVATVPLTIDWGNKNKGHSRRTISRSKKKLPPPPTINEQHDLVPKVLGRSGFGAEVRPSSPLLREWSDDEDINDTYRLSRRPAMRRHSRRSSSDSVESIWFAPEGFDISSKSNSLNNKSGSDEHFSGSLSLSDSIQSILDSSIETWASARSRIRIYNHENSETPAEIHVGALYEVISYVWDTMSHPYNIGLLAKIFSKHALPRADVVNLVASKSLPLDRFLQSADLHVHINPSQKPRYTSLDVLEITLQQNLVDALNTAREPHINYLRGLIRVAMIQSISEFIYNHVLIHDGFDLMISPSIDLARTKSADGGDITSQALFGGSLRHRWKSGRMQILLWKEKKLYRVPEKVLGEMYNNIKVCAFELSELDL